jgi:HPt (histidine-containing phosphotransfer) domain-containing protein
MTEPLAPRDVPGALDAQALARLAELDPQGGGDLVQRVLRTYAASLERLMGDFKRARAAGQSASLRQVAHTLKSSSASIGALRLSALCAEIEQRVRDGRDLDQGGILDSVEIEAVGVAAAVHAMLAP